MKATYNVTSGTVHSPNGNAVESKPGAILTATTTTTTTIEKPNTDTSYLNNPDFKQVSKFRTLLPQILASTAKNLLLIDLGLAVAFPTIVIPVLRGLQNEKNPDETIFMTAVEASWYGSIAYISQPISSALSGWVSEPIGRKRAMILVNIPHIIAWTLLYFATTKLHVYIAAILLGVGVGFMEAPIITYVGEISQPSIRGILIACAGVAAMLGFFIVYLLGTTFQWRNVAIMCLSVPIVTVIAISFIPETPMWLLSKDRKEDALKSLQWLRGWVPAKNVENEFAEMQRYSETSNSCIDCQKKIIKCTHPPAKLLEKLKALKQKRTIRPFILVLFSFFISQFGGLTSIRTYLVQIFKAYNVPIDPNWGTVVIGLMGLLANVVCTCIIKVIGKRKLYFFSLTGTGLSCFSLAIYAMNVLPANWSSFDKHESLEMPTTESYFAMMMFFSLAFFTSVGLTPIPWILLSEVFPFKSRGVATGTTAAINYIFTFVSIKTYLNVENFLSLSGTMFFYGTVNVIGLCVMYIILPETENRTLEEIEMYFSDKKRKITDRQIIKSPKPCYNNNENGKIHDDKQKVTNKISIEEEKGCDNKALEL